jgi:alkyl sulfatase BDS1-like metallo-beta-lactamase superfamily hydrolase
MPRRTSAPSFELRLDEDRFRVRIGDGTIDLDRGLAESPDAIIETDVDILRAVVWQGRKLSEALRAGEITIEGDRRAVTRFVGLFPQPETAILAAAAA